MLKEDVVQKDKKEELEESCCAEQKSQKKGPDKTHEKPPAEKVYPSPSCFSRRLAALKARQARDEAGPANVVPHDNEVVDISSDTDSEQVPEYLPGEEARIEEEGEEVPDYLPGAEPMGQEEDPEEDPEEDTEEEPEEDPEEDLEEDPEEDPEEEQPEAMEQNEDQEEENQEMAFEWANQEQEKEDDEEEDVPDLRPGIPDYDEYFRGYFKLAPPPSLASDEESDDE
ncbi:hypothetical protein PIB30_019885 [Stylosanthes scabra]|uniref:Uncharacterized protein n=1 Tax=Stylosanthes scabra TaxID=79078 RepID=A0ABU6T886_9FABA|nr:hypothetical protein [Stylosanthes scabra]